MKVGAGSPHRSFRKPSPITSFRIGTSAAALLRPSAPRRCTPLCLASRYMPTLSIKFLLGICSVAPHRTGSGSRRCSAGGWLFVGGVSPFLSGPNMASATHFAHHTCHWCVLVCIFRIWHAVAVRWLPFLSLRGQPYAAAVAGQLVDYGKGGEFRSRGVWTLPGARPSWKSLRAPTRSRLSLGGEEREITILFCDIRGFHQPCRRAWTLLN